MIKDKWTNNILNNLYNELNDENEEEDKIKIKKSKMYIVQLKDLLFENKEEILKPFIDFQNIIFENWDDFYNIGFKHMINYKVKYNEIKYNIIMNFKSIKIYDCAHIINIIFTLIIDDIPPYKFSENNSADNYIESLFEKLDKLYYKHVQLYLQYPITSLINIT